MEQNVHETLSSLREHEFWRFISPSGEQFRWENSLESYSPKFNQNVHSTSTFTWVLKTFLYFAVGKILKTSAIKPNLFALLYLDEALEFLGVSRTDRHSPMLEQQLTQSDSLT